MRYVLLLYAVLCPRKAERDTDSNIEQIDFVGTILSVSGLVLLTFALA